MVSTQDSTHLLIVGVLAMLLILAVWPASDAFSPTDPQYNTQYVLLKFPKSKQFPKGKWFSFFIQDVHQPPKLSGPGTYTYRNVAQLLANTFKFSLYPRRTNSIVDAILYNALVPDNIEGANIPLDRADLVRYYLRLRSLGGLFFLSPRGVKEKFGKSIINCFKDTEPEKAEGGLSYGVWVC